MKLLLCDSTKERGRGGPRGRKRERKVRNKTKVED
jgi:hypothetical protein